MASAAWRKRNARAQAAGFRNYYEYRKTLEKRKGARAAADAAGRRGVARYYGAGLEAGKIRLPGRKGSRVRGRAIAQLVAQIVDAGGNPDAFLNSIGSPRRRKR